VGLKLRFSLKEYGEGSCSIDYAAKSAKGQTKLLRQIAAVNSGTFPVLRPMRTRPPLDMKLLKEMIDDLVRELEQTQKEPHEKDSRKGEKSDGSSSDASV
jgi:hypothetical protein